MPRGTVQTNLGAFGRPFVDSPGAFHLAAPAGAFGEFPPGPVRQSVDSPRLVLEGPGHNTTKTFAAPFVPHHSAGATIDSR